MFNFLIFIFLIFLLFFSPSEINMLVDRSECVIQLLAEQDVVIGGLDEALQVHDLILETKTLFFFLL